MNINNQILFFGGGNMAEAIIIGLLNNKIDKKNIFVIDIDEKKRNDLKKRLSINTYANKVNLDKDAIIFLATKPDQIKLVCADIKNDIDNQLIISIAAGIKIKQIENYLNGYDQIIRTMPNLIAQIQKSITAACAHPSITEDRKKLVTNMLNTFGDTIWLKDEEKINAVTAISGSGPAYVFYFLNAIIEAGKEIGLSENESQLLSLKMLQGSSQFAEKFSSELETIISNVTSKGGTTEQALKHFKNKNFQKVIVGAIRAAYSRAKEIGEK